MAQEKNMIAWSRRRVLQYNVKQEKNVVLWSRRRM
jgi:hypothetical protein